jgi:hypothetical protein
LFKGDNPIELAINHDLTKSNFLLCREKQEITGQDGLGHVGHIIVEEITATDPVAGSTSTSIDIIEVEGNRVFSLTKGTDNIEVHIKVSVQVCCSYQSGRPANLVQSRQTKKTQ